jgi:hypothetical protein
MKMINPEEVKKVKDARVVISDLQRRLFETESLLDDLARSVEIAQYSRQYHLTETFVRQAEELLQDRLVMPEVEMPDLNLTIVEGSLDPDQLQDINSSTIKQVQDGVMESLDAQARRS